MKQSGFANHFNALVALVDAMPLHTPMHAAVAEAAKKAALVRTTSDGLDFTAFLDTPLGGNDMAAWFMALRARKDAPVVILKQFACVLAEKLDLAEDHPLLMPLLMAAVLGGVRMTNKFHSHHHTREVLCLSGILAWLHNGRAPFADAGTRLAEIVIAAGIHDFAHDGQGNGPTPMRLENNALDKAEPYLEAVGIPEASWQRIKAMVLATDVNKINGQDSPADWMRKAYNGQAMDAGCPEALQPFYADRALAVQAALLEDADLGTSAGMSYEFARRMTALIAQETKAVPPSPKTLINFIDNICGGAYVTDAAHVLFGNSLQILRRAAMAEKPDTVYKIS